MSRNLRILGLALVAMLSLGIASASASAAEFHSESASTTLTGTQEGQNTFVTDSGTWHCQTVSYSGTASAATVSTVTVTPTFSNCRITGFIEATVTIDTNGCKFEISVAGSVKITGCTNTNKSISVTMPFCRIDFTESNNTAIAPLDFENLGTTTTREVRGTSTISNVRYDETGAACKNNGTTTTTNGTYTGKVVVTGTSSGFHTGIWWL